MNKLVSIVNGLKKDKLSFVGVESSNISLENMRKFFRLNENPDFELPKECSSNNLIVNSVCFTHQYNPSNAFFGEYDFSNFSRSSYSRSVYVLEFISYLKSFSGLFSSNKNSYFHYPVFGAYLSSNVVDYHQLDSLTENNNIVTNIISHPKSVDLIEIENPKSNDSVLCKSNFSEIASDDNSSEFFNVKDPNSQIHFDNLLLNRILGTGGRNRINVGDVIEINEEEFEKCRKDKSDFPKHSEKGSLNPITNSTSLNIRKRIYSDTFITQSYKKQDEKNYNNIIIVDSDSNEDNEDDGCNYDTNNNLKNSNKRSSVLHHKYNNVNSGIQTSSEGDNGNSLKNIVPKHRRIREKNTEEEKEFLSKIPEIDTPTYENEDFDEDFDSNNMFPFESNTENTLNKEGISKTSENTLFPQNCMIFDFGSFCGVCSNSSVSDNMMDLISSDSNNTSSSKQKKHSPVFLVRCLNRNFSNSKRRIKIEKEEKISLLVGYVGKEGRALRKRAAYSDRPFSLAANHVVFRHTLDFSGLHYSKNKNDFYLKY
jgi:hypothetical protein